jgi:hypothetical protein
MLARLYSIISLTTVFGLLVFTTGCIFPDEQVTLDIEGSDEIPANISKANGFRIKINNEADNDWENMTVMITVPENINFGGRPGGKEMKIEKGLEWVYSYTDTLRAVDTKIYSFSYEPVIYASQFGDELEWSFAINVQVSAADGQSLGNQSTTWRVTR